MFTPQFLFRISTQLNDFYSRKSVVTSEIPLELAHLPLRVSGGSTRPSSLALAFRDFYDC